MVLISMRQFLDYAADNDCGVPAFNVNNLKQMRDIMEGAQSTNSLEIVLVSAGDRKDAGSNFLLHLKLAAVEGFAHIPLNMHQDHGVSANLCQRSMQMIFTSMMMDGPSVEDKKIAAEYGCNADVTRRVVEIAYARGVFVAGELGSLGSFETGTAGEGDGVWAEGVLNMDQLLADPEEAADFFATTEVDALAIAVGTSHGAYKFSRPPSGHMLATDRIRAIHERVPNAHLVMHGSSSVPQDLLKEINECGGEIAEIYEVPVQEIQQDVKHGLRKVNIDIELRLAPTGSIRRSPSENPAEFDPRKYFAVSQKPMKEVVVARFEAFAKAGNADKVHAKSLKSMFMNHAAGQLTPLVA